MKINKRERLLLGGLGAGLCALVADRLFVLDPASADAATATATTTVLEADPLAISDLPKSLRSGANAEKNPEELVVSVPDIFNPTRLPIPAKLTPPDEAEAAKTAQTSQFQETYRLFGVILGPDPVAIIGRANVRIGDNLGGFVLTEIAPNQAIFENAIGERRVLHVPGRVDSNAKSDH